jgi:site-specific DNA-methyltransferase (adenine-specific)
MTCPRPSIDDVLAGRADWALVHGRAEDVLPSLPRRAVAHVLTDPPYSRQVHQGQRRLVRGTGRVTAGAVRRNDVATSELGFDSLSPELRRVCGMHLPRVARRWLLVKCDAEGQAAWQAELERAGARHVRVGVWHKLGAQPQLSGDRPAVGHEAFEVAHVRGERLRWNGGGLHAVWTHPIATGERLHTTQTPVSLWMELVAQFSEPGDLVLDPFAGSGSLGVACLRLGRRYLGIEMQAHYADTARDWLSAEARGLTLAAARGGQLGLFAGAAP